MQIIKTSVLYGPNIYGPQQFICHTLKFEAFSEASSPGFNRAFIDELYNGLPGLRHHDSCCAASTEFEQAILLNDPFPIAHLLEHICIELQNLIGLDFRCARCHAGYQIQNHQMVYPFDIEEVGMLAAKLALNWLNSLLRDAEQKNATPEFDFAAQRDVFIKHALRLTPPVQDRAMIKSSLERDIPVMSIAIRLFQLGQGCYQQRFSGSKTSRTNIVSNDIAANKDYCKRIFLDLGIPVAEYRRVYLAQDAVLTAQDIGYPVVVKPNNGQMGRGVSIGMKNKSEVRAAFVRARKYGRSVIVEKFIPGKDFRMMVINNKLVAASNRVPAHVVGDGKKNIEQLVADVNSDPRRGDGPQQPWTCIEFNEQSERLLTELGYTHQSVPKRHEIVYLRHNANTSDGGISVDVTDEVHPQNRDIAVRAVKAIGLDVAGVDFLLNDISKPMIEQGGCICEINSRPGLRKHIWPGKGKPRDVTGAIVSMLFPPASPSRITIAAVTGTGETALTAQILAHLLIQDGRKVGLATRDGVYIDGRPSGKPGTVGLAAIRMILFDPDVDCAVIESLPGTVLQQGLGYDCCDVCAVVNTSKVKTGLEQDEAIRVVTATSRNAVVLGNGDDSYYPPASHKEEVDIYQLDLNDDTPSVDADGQRLIVRHQDSEGQSTHVVEKGSLLAQIPLEAFLAKENGQPAKVVTSAEFAASLAARLNVNSKLISRELGCVKPSVSVHRMVL